MVVRRGEVGVADAGVPPPASGHLAPIRRCRVDSRRRALAALGSLSPSQDVATTATGWVELLQSKSPVGQQASSSA